MPEDNVLIVMSDDHGQWCTGAYGNDLVQTPTIDHLADTGVRFENAFCPTPVCSPARASFFTGRRPSQHGVHDWIRDSEYDGPDILEDERLLPELLSEAGYETALAGKWHCGEGRDREAFDHVYSVFDGDWPFSKHSLTRDRRTTEAAIDFLREERDTDRPFFLFVGYVGTHAGWSGGPERLVEQYRQRNFPDIHQETTHRHARADVMSPDEREALPQYYAAAQGIDEQLGRLVDELDDQEALAETLVTYTADHGHNCGHHGFWGKGNGTRPQNMLDESIEVPLIVGGHESVRGNQVRDDFVDHCDLFETILAFTGADRPTDRTYPGQSVLPAIQNADGQFSRDQEQICEYGDVRAIRTDQYKFVRRYFDAPDLMFDLDEDPRETRNVAEEQAYAAVRDRLQNRLEEEFESTTDPEWDGSRIQELPRYSGSEAWRDRLSQ